MATFPRGKTVLSTVEPEVTSGQLSLAKRCQYSDWAARPLYLEQLHYSVRFVASDDVIAIFELIFGYFRHIASMFVTISAF